jgi:hypothetical protein
MSALPIKRETFATSRLLDFFSEKELVAQIGHSKADWPLVAIKELLDNALDACEETGVPPEIAISLTQEALSVQDNGPGLPAEVIARILDYSVRISSREAYCEPARGAQGNALKTLMAMPFVLSGNVEGRLTVRACGIEHQITVRVDRIRQIPLIRHQPIPAPEVQTGTFVQIHWPRSACSLLGDFARMYKLALTFVCLNPHLTLTFQHFAQSEDCHWPAIDPTWNKWTAQEPHVAHWYTPERFERLVAAYLAQDEEAGQLRLVSDFIAEFRGFARSSARKSILEVLALERKPLTRFATSDGVDRRQTDRLLELLQTQSRTTDPLKLGLIGKERIGQRLAQSGYPMATFKYQRLIGDDRDGLPRLFETAFAYHPERNRRLLLTGINWSAALINPFRQLGSVSTGLESHLQELRAGEDEPIALLVHLAGPGIQYTDRGKSAVVVE